MLTCRRVLEEACGGKVWNEGQQERPSAQLRDRARCHSWLLTAGPKLMIRVIFLYSFLCILFQVFHKSSWYKFF